MRINSFLFTGILIVSTLLGACGEAGTSSGTDRYNRLQGKIWTLLQENNRNDEIYTIVLNDNGLFQARVDCNQVTGKYNLMNNALSFSPGPSTSAQCPENSFDKEFLMRLSRVNRYQLTSDQLTLWSDDIQLLVFQ